MKHLKCLSAIMFLAISTGGVSASTPHDETTVYRHVDDIDTLHSQLKSNGTFYHWYAANSSQDVNSLSPDSAREQWRILSYTPTNAKRLHGEADLYSAARGQTSSLLRSILARDQFELLPSHQKVLSSLPNDLSSPPSQQQYVDDFQKAAIERDAEQMGSTPAVFPIGTANLGTEEVAFDPYKDLKTEVDFLYKEWDTDTASYALQANRRFLQLITFNKGDTEPELLLKKILHPEAVIQNVPGTDNFLVKVPRKSPEAAQTEELPLSVYSLEGGSVLVIVLNKDTAMFYSSLSLDPTSWFMTDEQLESMRKRSAQRDDERGARIHSEDPFSSNQSSEDIKP